MTLRNKISDLSAEKKAYAEDLHRAELEYKGKLLEETIDKENLMKDLELLKVKIKDLEGLLRKKDMEIEKLDSKLNELIRIRRQIGDLSACFDPKAMC